MWILKWLPDWIFYFILLSGVVGFALTYLLKYLPIPFIYMYKTPIQLGSLIAIIVGTFMSGAAYDNRAWEDRVHELESKIKVAEQKSIEANAVIDAKVEEETVKIVEKRIVLKEYVDRVLTTKDASCEIPKEFIEVVNKAANDERK